MTEDGGTTRSDLNLPTNADGSVNELGSKLASRFPELASDKCIMVVVLRAMATEQVVSYTERDAA